MSAAANKSLRVGLVLAACSVAVVAAPGAVGAGAPDTVAADVGDLWVASPDNAAVAVTGGGSAVEFVVAPPAQSTCPGDSAHDQWRLQSFLIPESDPVTELKWGPEGPAGVGQWALYGTDTRAVQHELLARNPGPGSPGQILEVRPVTFAVFTDDILAPGRYRMGLVCTYFGKLDRYWDAIVDVTFDAADQPARLRWQVAPSGAASPSRPTRWPVEAVAAVTLAIGAGLIVALRRSKRAARPQRPSVAGAPEPFEPRSRPDEHC